MRRTVVGLACSVGLLTSLPVVAAPGAAPAAAPGPRWSHEVVERLLGAGRPGRDAARGLAARGSDEHEDDVVVGGSAQVQGFGYALPTGDLDGRGGADLLDVRVRTGPTGRSTAVHARDGWTGAVRWSRTVSDPRGEGYRSTFVTTLATARGRSLVVLLTFADEGDGEVSMTLTGLDGRDGRQRWRVARTGKHSYSEDGYQSVGVPFVTGVLAGPGGTEEMVVQQDDVTDDGSSLSSRAVAFSVRATDGRVRGLGPALESEGGLASFWPVADATGDGHDDLVALAPGAPGPVPGVAVGPPASLVQLRSGVDGRAVWQRDDLALEAYPSAWSLGPVTSTRSRGRTVSDVGIASGGRERRGARVQGTLGRSTTTDSVLTALRGTDGEPVWAGLGDGAVGTGQGRVVTFLVRDEQHVSDEEASVVVTSHAPDGEVEWQQTRTETSAADGFAFAFVTPYPAGDLQPDGRSEVYYALVALDDEGVLRQTDGVLDGRSGAGLDVPLVSLLGPAASLTGKGDDRVTVQRTGKALTVSALRGHTSRRLWVRRIALPADDDAFAYAGPARGRCVDVVVATSGRTTAHLAVLATDGRVRWSVTRAATDLRPTRAVGGAPFTVRCG